MSYCNDEEAMRDDTWKKVDNIHVEVAPKRDKSVVFTMKIDKELLRVLVDHARERGMPTSTLARDLIKEGLLSRIEHMPTHKLAEVLLSRVEHLEEELSKLEKPIQDNVYSQYKCVRVSYAASKALGYDSLISNAAETLATGCVVNERG